MNTNQEKNSPDCSSQVSNPDTSGKLFEVFTSLKTIPVGFLKDLQDAHSSDSNHNINELADFVSPKPKDK